MNVLRDAGRTLLFLVICVAILIMSEGILRLFHYHQMVRYMEDKNLPYVMIPNQNAYTSMGRLPVKINAHSMRGEDVTSVKADNSIRILLLGDSVIYGDRIRERDLVVNRIESILDSLYGEQYNFEVLNGGVKGYTSQHEYEFFRSHCLDLQLDMVLVAYCVNDQVGSGDLRRGVRILIPKRGGAGVLKQIKESATYQACYLLIRRIAGAMRKDLPPSYYGFIQQGELSSFQRANWEASASAITELSDLCHEKGIRLAVVAFPIEPQLRGDYAPESAEPQGRLRDLCSEIGIPFVDLLGSFREARDMPIYIDQIHLTEIGHALAARETVRRLQAYWLPPPMD